MSTGTQEGAQQLRFRPEAVKAIAEIRRLLEVANNIFQTELNASENHACFSFSNEGTSLNHCLRWGEQTALDIEAQLQQQTAG